MRYLGLIKHRLQGKSVSLGTSLGQLWSHLSQSRQLKWLGLQRKMLVKYAFVILVSEEVKRLFRSGLKKKNFFVVYYV